MPVERTTRRAFALGLTAGAAASRAQAACLQARSARWIVPNPPGGGFDAYSRLLAPYVGRALGVDARVDNQPGAAGLFGARMIRDARPDGATLGLVNMPGLLMSQELDSFDLDPVNELTLLGTVSRMGYYWATAASSDLKSSADLIARARKGRLVIGANGAGGTGPLTSAMAVDLLGWDVQFVPGYSGSATIILAVLRREVDVAPLSWDVLLPHIRSGDLRPLLAIDGGFSKEFPELAGVRGLTGPDGLLAEAHAAEAASLLRFMQIGRVIAAPAGLDGAVDRCLSDAVCAALHDAKLAREALAGGGAVEPICAAETRERAREAQADVRRLAPLARRAIANAGF